MFKNARVGVSSINDTVVTRPLTYDDLQQVKDKLKYSVPFYPQAIISANTFKYMLLLSNYCKGTQIIKRNYHPISKKKRYKKTFKVPHIKVINSEHIEINGQRVIKTKDIR